MTTPISCYLLTLNSERRLEQVLTAVRTVADEILVVDSGSQDRTIEIAQQFGCRILTRPFDNFRDQRVFAESRCLNDWILKLDSDEVLSPELAEEIADLKARDFQTAAAVSPDGYTVSRQWFLLGRNVHVFYPVRAPDVAVRLFRRDRIGHHDSPLVHERISGSVDGLGHLAGPLLHYTCDTVDQLYAKIHLYTRLSAEQMYNDGVSCNLIKLHAYPWLLAFKWYVLLGGWRDGAIGTMHARYVRDVVYLKYLKLRYDFHVKPAARAPEPRGLPFR